MSEVAAAAARGTGILAGVLLLAVLCGCGQRGPLYLPDRNAKVVTRPAAAPGSAPASVPGSAPASAPAAPPAARPEAAVPGAPPGAAPAGAAAASTPRSD
ncbi:MAG TPA: lipoprotein [Steroidobacteraceae bacterium]|nr:lipoprotein [Steroidobacteraceae bacterium]